jgi:hypothetical protein
VTRCAGLELALSPRGRSLIAAIQCLAFVISVAPVGHAQSNPRLTAYALASDGRWLDPQRDHLAISRELPIIIDPAQPTPVEPEAVRLVVVGASLAPSSVSLRTLRRSGALLDALATLPLVPWPCPPGNTGAVCWSTQPLRLTPDRLDRDYPAARTRSLEADLGGELQVNVGQEVLGSWRIGAPHSPVFGGFDRLSLKLRVRVLRLFAEGPPAIGGSAAAAMALARAEVRAASQLWSQCGIDLQGPSEPDIQVVDPPGIQLVAVGCNRGLPASGGEIVLSIQGRRVRVASHAGESPDVVAARLARALRGLGLGIEVRVSPNPRMTSGASGAVDVLVRGTHGVRASIAADADPAVPLSTDSTLGVCLGEVDLGNGLSHFVESDAAAGTLEERSLIKAFDDGDPSTIEVFIVPSFDQSGRIGESFIDDDGAGIQNTVIIDRAAVRAGPRSYALAHELGHILLDMPGHPDDYGVDQSGSLMDSDASDASVFGPRRLTLAECERALRESGPDARVPLLKVWPLTRPTATPTTSAR